MYKLAYRSLFRKSSMLRKLLLSMIGLVCIPLILIQIYTIQRSTDEFYEAQHTQTLSYLQSINASFQQHIDELKEYGVKIGSTTEVKYPLQQELEEYKLYEAASKIKEFNSAYPLVKCVGVCYPTTDRVVYNGFCYTVADFIGLYFPLESEGAWNFENFLCRTIGAAFFSTGEHPDSLAEQLMFARSVPIGGGVAENAIIFFALDNQRLESWCSGFLSQNAGFAITLSSGEHLFHTGQLLPGLFDSEAYCAFSEDLSRWMFPVNDDDETLIYKYHSPESDYVIFAAVPQNHIHENVEQYMTQVRLALILTFLVTIIFTAVTAYINYKPIVTLLRKHASADMDTTVQSELDLLDSAFFLRDRQISNQDNLIRTFLVSDILSGDLVDPKEQERYFPQNEHLRFAVSLTDVIFTTAQTAAIIEKAAQTFDVELMITTIPERKETIFVFSSPEDLSHREEMLRELVLQTMGFECGFVSGGVVEHIKDIDISYKEAMERYRQLTGSLQVTERYPAQLIQEFGNCLRRNNLEEALPILEGLRQKLPAYTPMYQKIIGLDLMRTYMHNVTDGDAQIQEMSVMPENVSVIFTMLRNAIEKRQHATESGSKDVNKELKELLIAYVNQNCLDSTMCLTAAADHMGTSIYTVSRLFKEATGMGFKDYITSKRLKYACHLLVSTNLSVNAIAAECGFERIAYFSTIFKNEYGMAPSIYRSTHQKGDIGRDENE